MITSIRNIKIKNLLKLQQKSSEREKQNLIVFEGYRELCMALSSGIIIKTLFLCPDIWGSEIIEGVSEKLILHVSKDVFNKIAYRENSDGLIAEAETPVNNLNKLPFPKKALFLILEGIEKPGNLGAVFRTADAAGVDAIIISKSIKFDIYNANAIRASLGCIFTVPIGIGTNDEILHILKENNIKIYAATPCSEVLYHRIDMTEKSCAIVLGSEARGLSDFWIEVSDEKIKIPMYGKTNSLNVSVSAAIIIFEAIRQRNL